MSTGVTGLNQLLLLLLVAFVVALVARKTRAPYSLALVIAGLVIGIPHLLPKVHLDPTVLMTVLLPPLLFETALNLHVDLLRRDWMPIAIYTVAGTAASTIVIGAAAALLGHIPLMAGLLFGALISTTDPISVVAVFKKLGAPKRLALIMEAESLFNNDVAVVLYTVILGLVAGSGVSYGLALLWFIQLAVGGAVVGIIIGLLASRLHYELDDHLIEITLTTVVAFGSYLVAEKLHTSGVMAVVTAGITLGSYGMQKSMTPGTQLAVTAFWEYAAFVVNSMVFLLIGIEVGYIDWRRRALLAVAAFLVVLAGRAVIYPISILVNRLGGRVVRQWQHVLVWGGLRGALSMALALGLRADLPYRDTIIAATFGVVLLSLLIQGSTSGMLLRHHNVVVNSDQKELRLVAAELAAVRGALAEIDRLRSAEAHPGWALEALTRDYRYRERKLYDELELIKPGHAAEIERIGGRTRKAVLIAEKSTLAEARKQGILEAEDYDQLASRIDRELLALRKSV